MFSEVTVAFPLRVFRKSYMSKKLVCDDGPSARIQSAEAGFRKQESSRFDTDWHWPLRNCAAKKTFIRYSSNFRIIISCIFKTDQTSKPLWLNSKKVNHFSLLRSWNYSGRCPASLSSGYLLVCFLHSLCLSAVFFFLKVLSTSFFHV